MIEWEDDVEYDRGPAAARVDVMSPAEAIEEIYFWHGDKLTVSDRERAFDDLIGWVAGQAQVDRFAAAELRRIRDRAERS